MKTWVYVSGPYTGGDVVKNVRKAILVGLQLRKLGYVPIIPHLFHFIHYLKLSSYEFWMSWDMDLLERCDAIFRIPGDSPGADKEVNYMEGNNKFVYIASEEDMSSSFYGALAFAEKLGKETE